MQDAKSKPQSGESNEEKARINKFDTPTLLNVLKLNIFTKISSRFESQTLNENGIRQNTFRSRTEVMWCYGEHHITSENFGETEKEVLVDETTLSTPDDRASHLRPTTREEHTTG